MTPTMSSHPTTLATGLALSTLFLLACGDGRAAQEGELGNLTFTFPVADGQEDFDRPIALGARLRLRVEGREGEDANVERIEAATVDPETVLSAQRSQVRPDELILTAREQGTATVTVDAALSGVSAARTDRVSFRVRPVSSISLEHQCTQSRAAAYLTNQPITLGYARFDAERRRMIGEGACEVDVTPEAGIDRTRCDEATLEVPPIADPGPYVVGSSRSARNGSLNRLDLNIVDPQILDFDPIQETLEEGRSREVELLPRTPDWDVCTPLEFQVFILTPDVCRGDDTNSDRFTVFRDEDNRIDLRGLRAGTCEFEVSLPALGVQDAWLFTLPVNRDD
jgi:hypothetical protein